MLNKDRKKIGFRAGTAYNNFIEEQLASYLGLVTLFPFF